jgi:hypothetical protein
MTQRSLPPLSPRASVRVEVLSSPQAALSAEAVELSGKRLQLLLPAPRVPGNTVKFEAQECLLRGWLSWGGPGLDRGRPGAACPVGPGPCGAILA